jgi:NAD(P)-dependent dehydrogenase (short-subunit alcohol dehydrogenase family)
MVQDLFNLSGKTALVTGSSAGLGAAIAEALAEAGADVICHGNSRPAAETCRKIQRQNGRRATAIQADLSQPSGAEELFAKARSFAPIDIVVNNAGVIKRAPADEYPLEDWDLVLQVNLKSLFQLSQLAGRDWIENNRPGKILNIASLLAFQGGITVPAYAASKGGVAQLTWPTNGRHAGLTSTRSRPATCSPAIPLPYSKTRRVTGKSWSEFPLSAGASPPTLAARRFSCVPQQVITSTAMSWW